MTPPSLKELTRVSTRIGFLSFGGPAAQISLMHREFVEERPWLTERQYLGALSFCMLLPGPEAMQLATYVGWRLRGITGGLIAGGLFVLPGAFIILALALIYANFGAQPIMQALFLGVKAAVIIVVLQALLKVSKKALTGAQGWVIAALAFVGIFALHIPFPVIIAAAAVWGFSATSAKAEGDAPTLNRSPLQTLAVIAIGAALWAAPFALTLLMPDPLLTQIGLFFSKLAVVTFGGAYAVLGYMTQEVVGIQGWLTTDEMVDGLGLAETTPGPLILVTEFVGTLSAHKAGGLPLALAAAALTIWVTFVPCFIWIFAGAPYIEWITHQPRLKGALDAITAAVVGVIANLSLWFAAHVFFSEVGSVTRGPLHLIAPNPATFDPMAGALAVAAGVCLVWLRLSLPLTLALMAVGGALLSWAL